MSDLISRQGAIDELKKYQDMESNNFTDTDPLVMMTVAIIADCIEVIVNLPPAEPERTAKVKRFSLDVTLTCDFDGQCECGKWVESLWDYCPSCGAKLDWSE